MSSCLESLNSPPETYRRSEDVVGLGDADSVFSTGSICGISVGVAPKKELEAKMPVRPINVRTMNGVDLENLKIKKADGWSQIEPQYEVK